MAAPSALLAYEMPAGPCSASPTTGPHIPLGVAPAAPSYGYPPAAYYGASTTTSPYSAPATASPYGYGSINSGLSSGTGGVAKNPVFGAAVTVSDVIAMARAKVANELIISQFRNHGLAAPLRPADVITLSQSGVSTEVIAALQTAVAKEELCDPSPYHAAPTVMNSNYETSPPAAAPPAQAPARPVERSPSLSAGSIAPATSGDPPRRAQEAIYTSENLRLLQDELERSRSLEGPANVTKGMEEQIKNGEWETTSKVAKSKDKTSPESGQKPAPTDRKPSDEPRDFHKEEDSLWHNSYRNFSGPPILPPIQPGAACSAMDAPSEGEVMKKLEKARPIENSAQCKVERNRVRIVSKMIQDCLDPPRIMPLVGPVQVHHMHWKCTVYFKEVIYTNEPKPHTTVDEDCQEVIYVDRDHLHRVGKEETAEAPSDPAEK